MNGSMEKKEFTERNDVINSVIKEREEELTALEKTSEDDSKYLENIKKELDIPADEYLKNTPLGYIEKPLKIDLVHKVMRKIVNKALPRLEGNGELDKFSSLRFAMTILLLRLKTNTYTLPSQRYLSKKFIKLTKDVYNSKKA